MQPAASRDGFEFIGPHGDSEAVTRFSMGPHADMSDEERIDEDDDEADETFGERLLGLTEMLPEPVRYAISGAANLSWKATKGLYSMGRVALWVTVSSATILALPVLFENERMQMEEQQIQQQRQILLGPNVATSGHLPSGVPHPMAPLPQVSQPR